MGGYWSIYSSYLGVRCIAIWSIRNKRFLCIILVDRSPFGMSRCLFPFPFFFCRCPCGCSGWCEFCGFCRWLSASWCLSVRHKWWLLKAHLIPRPCVFNCYAMFLLCICYSFHFKNSRDLIGYHSFFLPL